MNIKQRIIAIKDKWACNKCQFDKYCDGDPCLGFEKKTRRMTKFLKWRFGK